MPDQLPPLREVVVDDAMRRGVSAALLRYLLLRPVSLIVVVVIALIMVPQAIAALSRGGWPGLAVIPFVVLLVYPGIVVLLVRRAMRRSLPVGSRLAASVGPDRLFVESPVARSEIAYSAYRSVRVSPGAVILLTRQRTAQALPRALSTDDDVARLHARIGETAPA